MKEMIIFIALFTPFRLVSAFGYLTVLTEPKGMEVFLDGNSLGRSPIELYKLKPGVYTVSLFPSDSVEDCYWRARERGVFEIIKMVPEFARYHSASVRVQIQEDQETEVRLSYPETLRAKRNASWWLYGGMGCLFATGIIFGSLLTLLFSGGK